MRSTHRGKWHRDKGNRLPTCKMKVGGRCRRWGGGSSRASTCTLVGTPWLWELWGNYGWIFLPSYQSLTYSCDLFFTCPATTVVPLQPKVSWSDIVIERMNFEVGLKYALILAPTNEYPLELGWMSFLFLLRPNFPICKMGMIWEATLQSCWEVWIRQCV